MGGTRLVRGWIPDGDAGTSATLDAMEVLVADGIADVRGTAERIVSGSSSARTRADRLRSWLSRRYAFRPDPPEIELVASPQVQLCGLWAGGRIEGDCDDLAVLAATLGAAVGLAPRFVVISLSPDGPYEHVWAELWTGHQWVDFDLVAEAQGLRPAQAAPRRAVRTLTLRRW